MAEGTKSLTRAQELAKESTMNIVEALEWIICALGSPETSPECYENAKNLVNHLGYHADWSLVYRMAGLER